MNFREQIDYSAVSTYATCRRKFMFQYIFHLKSTFPSIDLVFGSAWHYGLEIAYKTAQNERSISATDLTKISIDAFTKYWSVTGANHFHNEDAIYPKSPGNAMNMYYEYWQRYHIELKEKKIVGVEIPFKIILPDTTTAYIGRMDLAFTCAGMFQIIDHKTAKYANDIIYAGFYSSLQTDGYLAAGKMYFESLPTMTYNIAICQKAKIDFPRYDVIKRDSATERFLVELKELIKDIHKNLDIYETEKSQNNSTSFIVKAFQRNPGMACTQYFRKCPYFDLCMTINNIYKFQDVCPSGFIKEEWNPEEHEAKITQLLNEV